MSTCPTCHLPTTPYDDEACCTVPLMPQRRAVIMAQTYRLVLETTPLDFQARREMLLQVDEQIDYLEGLYA